MVVEFADLLERLLELFVVVEPAAHLRHAFQTQPVWAGATTAIGDSEDIERAAFAAGALAAFGAMRPNGAMEQRAA
jgi:hypothetical protein